MQVKSIAMEMARRDFAKAAATIEAMPEPLFTSMVVLPASEVLGAKITTEWLTCRNVGVPKSPNSLVLLGATVCGLKSSYVRVFYDRSLIIDYAGNDEPHLNDLLKDRVPWLPVPSVGDGLVDRYISIHAPVEAVEAAPDANVCLKFGCIGEPIEGIDLPIRPHGDDYNVLRFAAASTCKLKFYVE